jgi:hypothetical protein
VIVSRYDDIEGVMRGALLLVLFFAVVGYSVTYFVVALNSDSTVWWWWFVPIYGTIKIFGASLRQGILHVGIVPAVYLGWSIVETWGSDLTERR